MRPKSASATRSSDQTALAGAAFAAAIHLHFVERTPGHHVPQLRYEQRAEQGERQRCERPHVVFGARVFRVFEIIEQRAERFVDDRARQILRAVEEAGRGGDRLLAAEVHGRGAAHERVRALNEERDEEEEQAAGPLRVQALREEQQGQRLADERDEDDRRTPRAEDLVGRVTGDEAARDRHEGRADADDVEDERAAEILGLDREDRP